MLNLVLKRRLDQLIQWYKHECEKKIASAKDEIIEANEWKQSHPVDWAMTNVMGEPSDGTARIDNAELNIQLAEETINFGEELENTFKVLDSNGDPRVLPDLYNALKKHLDKLESESEEIPEESRVKRRTNDLNDIKRFWIKTKINMVKSLLKKFPDGADFGTELQDFNGGRRRKRTGKKRGRSGTTRMRRGCTRRRLRRQ